ncbi:hypothetical protein [Nocardioides sp. B-3]|uniref:hypothetical protein n=1 Tax=Nocardioides sp. B-3 TaxID=2895565 RepID=UPI002152F064|nr:hypothetical protein [Nocardioides sp. B-3]UUZ61040.1 hypothetical protein LP418_10460 [Nocardioides sp. B-3]
MTGEADEVPGQTSFWRTAAVYTGGAMALQAFNLLLAPVFTHVMTTEELGLAANYLFWAALFGLVIGLQLHGSLNNAVTEHGAGSAIDFIRSVLPLYAVPTAVLVAVLLVAPGWWEAQLGLPRRWLLIAIANGVLYAMINMASVHAVISGRRGRYPAFTFVSTLGAAVLALVLMKFLDDAAPARIPGYVPAGAVAVMIAAPSPRRSLGHPAVGSGRVRAAHLVAPSGPRNAVSRDQQRQPGRDLGCGRSWCRRGVRVCGDLGQRGRADCRGLERGLDALVLRAHQERQRRRSAARSVGPRRLLRPGDGGGHLREPGSPATRGGAALLGWCIDSSGLPGGRDPDADLQPLRQLRRL